MGWGAHLGHLTGQGLWSPQEQVLSINVLELRAVYLALLHFKQHILNTDVLIRPDNVSTKAHVNRLGGTRSAILMQESLQLGVWAEAHLSSLKVDYIAGKANVTADRLSCTQVDHTEWNISPFLFRKLISCFGRPQVDLFSVDNHQLPRYFTRYPSPGAEAVDALCSPWPRGLLLYAFPPLALIPKVVRKLLQEWAELLHLAPHWPRQQWFPDLLSLSVAPLWRIPNNLLSLYQGNLVHPDPHSYQLTAWRLSGSC